MNISKAWYPEGARFLSIMLASFAMTFATHAQPTIDWFTLDAGGGIQSSANYLANFTVGQNDAGSSAQSSANYRIVSGFWALEDLGPATGLPELSITLKEATMILSWPSPSTGFVLQQTDSLDVLPPSWSSTLAIISDNGFTKSVSLPHSGAKRFYRLRRP